MFTTGNPLNCSYGGPGEEISDVYYLRAIRGYSYFARFPASMHRFGLHYIKISIPIHSEQTSNELRLQPLNPT